MMARNSRARIEDGHVQCLKRIVPLCVCQAWIEIATMAGNESYLLHSLHVLECQGRIRSCRFAWSGSAAAPKSLYRSADWLP